MQRHWTPPRRFIRFPSEFVFIELPGLYAGRFRRLGSPIYLRKRPLQRSHLEQWTDAIIAEAAAQVITTAPIVQYTIYPRPVTSGNYFGLGPFPEDPRVPQIPRPRLPGES